MDPDPHQNVMDPERSFIVMLGVFRVFFKLFFISTVLSALVKKMSFRFYERIFHRMDRWLLAVVGACLLLASSLVAQQQQQDEEGSGNGTERSTAESDYPGVVRTSVVDPDPVVSETFSRIRIRKNYSGAGCSVSEMNLK